MVSVVVFTVLFALEGWEEAGGVIMPGLESLLFLISTPKVANVPENTDAMKVASNFVSKI